jgi:hypothetical protein
MLDIVNEQRCDRLFSTVCFVVDDTGHADQRSLTLGPGWWIQLEICDSVKSAKRGQTILLLTRDRNVRKKIDNVVSNKLVATRPSV